MNKRPDAESSTDMREIMRAAVKSSDSIESMRALFADLIGRGIPMAPPIELPLCISCSAVSGTSVMAIDCPCGVFAPKTDTMGRRPSERPVARLTRLKRRMRSRMFAKSLHSVPWPWRHRED